MQCKAGDHAPVSDFAAVGTNPFVYLASEKPRMTAFFGAYRHIKKGPRRHCCIERDTEWETMEQSDQVVSIGEELTLLRIPLNNWSYKLTS